MIEDIYNKIQEMQYPERMLNMFGMFMYMLGVVQMECAYSGMCGEIDDPNRIYEAAYKFMDELGSMNPNAETIESWIRQNLPEITKPMDDE